MAVSQKQIAEKLGVSIALVSRVLSGKAAEIGIAGETIARVLKTADEMGYVPSAAALSLIGKATRTIGIAVYDFNDPFFGALIRAIQEQAHEHDYSLILAGFLNRIPDRQDLRALHKHTIDGLIVIGTDEQAGWLDDFKHLPVVRIGHGSALEKSTTISTDEKAASELLMEHLVQRGHRNLAFIGADLPAHRIRLKALQEAAYTHSIKLSTIGYGERESFAAGKAATPQILESFPQTEALVCATDVVAMGAIQALSGQGIKVPEQIAVTGFDDIPAAGQFIPTITTVRQSVHKMAEQAFLSLTGEKTLQRVSLPPQLVIRETT